MNTMVLTENFIWVWTWASIGMFFSLMSWLKAQCYRFLYTRSNIAPSHSSAPTSFLICNLPPKYRWLGYTYSCLHVTPYLTDIAQQIWCALVLCLVQRNKHPMRYSTTVDLLSLISCSSGSMVSKSQLSLSLKASLCYLFVYIPTHIL